MSQTLVALENKDLELAKYVLSEENKMDDIEKTLRERHLERLKSGGMQPEYSYNLC